MLTVGPGIDDLATQQDHHAVEELEAGGRGRVDGRANGHPSLQQSLYHHHHLRRNTDINKDFTVLWSMRSSSIGTESAILRATPVEKLWHTSQPWHNSP